MTALDQDPMPPSAAAAAPPLAPPAVLIVEDDDGLREGLVSVVRALGFSAVPASGLTEARAGLDTRPVDCVLLDIRLRDGDGLDFLRELGAGPHADLPVIVATAYGDSERTIRAMRDGAFDYVTKPFDLPKLRAVVERAVRHRGLLQTLPPASAATPAVPERGGLVGASMAMLGIWKLIGRAAASSAPVLITGETGTGKELVARAIHEYSSRSAEPFVAVNLAALPPTLIESELFGHEKGAFTGAAQRHQGRFELAGAGTLFLDEIGDLELSLQTKLLRVLQDGGFTRVGGGEPLHNHARILTATNKPVHPPREGAAEGGAEGWAEAGETGLGPAGVGAARPTRAGPADPGTGGPALGSSGLVGTSTNTSRAGGANPAASTGPGGAGGFLREDLYYRLAVIEIDVPPLRARRSDIPLLAAHALSGTSARAISEAAMARLLTYRWPGNVRELFHSIERAAVLGGGEVIDVDDLSEAIRSAPAAGRPDDPLDELPLREAVATLERRLIQQALQRAAGNRSEAARRLGISRAQLYAKLDEFGISGRGDGGSKT